MSVALTLPSAGTFPNDRSGDTLRDVVIKYNKAFNDILASVNNPANIDPASPLTIGSLTAAISSKVGTLPLTQFYDNATGLTPANQTSGTTTDQARFGASYYGGGTIAPGYSCFRSTSTSPGTRIPSPVSTRLGILSFAGEDNTRMIESNRIMAVTTALPSNSQLLSDLVFFSASSGIFNEYLRITSTGTMYAMDNVASLGVSGRRYSTVFLTTSPTVTSDARYKTIRGPMTPAEMAAAKDLARSIVMFKMNEEVVAKGEAAPLRCGIIAQEAVSILESHGLGFTDYAFVQHDSWPAIPEEYEVDSEGNVTDVVISTGSPAGERFSVVYEDLYAWIIAGNENYLSALNDRLAPLEAA